jgi:cobaltochelatase CobS
MGNNTKQFDDKGEKIRCEICGFWYHRLEVHVKKEHKISREEYIVRFPGKPTISTAARKNASRAKKDPRMISSPVKEAFFVNEFENGKAITGNEMSGNRKLDIGVASLEIVPDSELSATQLAEVPVNDDRWFPGKREKEYMEIIAAAIQDDDNVFIFGPPGGGKTTFLKQLGAVTNTPVVIFQFSNGISVEDFIGEKELVTDETGNTITKWRDGAFTRCWRNGYYIIFDEFTAAPANIMLRLHGPLDGNELIVIENGGEVIPKHPRTRIFATDNTNGRGDDSGMFTGTNVMNEATLDRFGTVIEFSYPDKVTERKILVSKTGISSEVAKNMVEVAVIVREAFNNEECYCTFSTRRLIAWAKKAIRFGDERKAAEISVLGRLSRDDSAFVDSIIQRIFGGTIG